MFFLESICKLIHFFVFLNFILDIEIVKLLVFKVVISYMGKNGTINLDHKKFEFTRMIPDLKDFDCILFVSWRSKHENIVTLLDLGIWSHFIYMLIGLMHKEIFDLLVLNKHFRVIQFYYTVVTFVIYLFE